MHATQFVALPAGWYNYYTDETVLPEGHPSGLRGYTKSVCPGMISVPTKYTSQGDQYTTDEEVTWVFAEILDGELVQAGAFPNGYLGSAVNASDTDVAILVGNRRDVTRNVVWDRPFGSI